MQNSIKLSDISIIADRRNLIAPGKVIAKTILPVLKMASLVESIGGLELF